MLGFRLVGLHEKVQVIIVVIGSHHVSTQPNIILLSGQKSSAMRGAESEILSP